MDPDRPTRLTPSPREKIWGSTRLEPWFPNTGAKIGEVWFLSDAPLPILVKLIFTSEKLSVQVHPGGPTGKTEMWHILRADPGARIALGFREPLTRERLRKASLSGEVEILLNWMEVAPGDTYFVPAGTVHAIGAGIALCEIQQNNDVTYRLYDYGRARELHVDQALGVSHLGPHPGKQVPDGNLLASCDYFRAETIALPASLPREKNFQLVIFLDSSGEIAGDKFKAGEVWLIPAGYGPTALQGASRAIRAMPPA